MKKTVLFFVSLFAAMFSLHVRAAEPSKLLHFTPQPQKLPPLVFEDANGNQHALSDYRGHFVLLNLWATWCPPCVHEMPSLDALQTSFKLKKLIVLALSEDRGDMMVSSFYASHHLMNLPVAIDMAGTAPMALHAHGLPTTLLINPEGLEIARFEGEVDWGSKDNVAFIEAQLADK